MKTSGGIFDSNKIEQRVSELDSEILKKDFWKDGNKSKKAVKEKNFLESIIFFYKQTAKDLNNLKDLYNLAIEEKDDETLNDCLKKYTNI